MNLFDDMNGRGSSAKDSAIPILTPQQDQEAATANAIAIRTMQEAAEKIAKEWENLSPELQESWLANSGTVAAGVTFLDNVLPWPVMSSVLTYINPQMAAQVNAAIAKNPEAARNGMIAGTIVGLVGGPVAVAKASLKGIKLLQSWKTASAGVATSAVIKKALKEMTAEAKKVLAKAGARGPALARKYSKDISEIKDFLDDWGDMLYNKRWSIDEIRSTLLTRLNGLRADHPIKKVLKDSGRGNDVYDNLWSSYTAAKQAPSTRLQQWFGRTMHNIKELDDNIKVTTAQFIVYFGADAASNWTYSYTDWRDKGYSPTESAKLAWAYTIDRTPNDLLAEGLASTTGKFKPIIDLLIRFGLLASDLGADGTVRDDVYGADGPNAFNSATETTNNAFGAANAQQTKGFNKGGLILNRPHPSGNPILGGV